MLKIPRRISEILRHAGVTVLRRDDNRWRIKRYLGLHRLRGRLRGPGLMIALGGLRQPAVGRRFDFKPPVARLTTGARIVMTDVRRGIDVAAAIDRGLHMHALAEAPVAFDDGIGCIDAVNDDGYAGAARNHDDGSAVGQGRPRRSDQNCQCQPSTHHLESRSLTAT
jgi:hypothetical protein